MGETTEYRSIRRFSRLMSVKCPVPCHAHGWDRWPHGARDHFRTRTPISNDESMEDRWSAVDDLLLRALAEDEPDRARLAELILDHGDALGDLVEKVRAAFPDWRPGQTWANVVRLLLPELYEEMTGTEIDPFYRDDRADAFRAWLTTRGEL